MDFSKLDDFINQLLNSVAIKKLSILEKEDNLFAFVNKNEDKLHMTFTSGEYYPGLDWTVIRFELIKRIGEKITEILKPKLQNIIYDQIKKAIDFPSSDGIYREKMFNLVAKLLSKSRTRRIYANIVNFIDKGNLALLLDAIYANRRTIYLGLSKFDSLLLKTTEEAQDFCFMSFMLLPIFDIALPMKVIAPQFAGDPDQLVTLRSAEDNRLIRNNFIAKIKDIITTELNVLSADYLDLLVKAFYVPEDADETPFNSKFIKIIYNMLVDYIGIKQDKGADSFERSWLTLAKTNYKFYGYEYNILDELYKITIEEGL